MPATGLSVRQFQFLPLGAAIGGGILVGAGVGVHAAGPAVLLAFVIVGVVVLVVARALGGMAAGMPGATFVGMTRAHLGPGVAFILGWSYLGCSVLTCLALLVALSRTAEQWLPSVPIPATALGVLIALIGINRLAVHRLGAIELWLASSKVMALVAIAGLGIVIAAAPTVLPGAGVANLWRDGGFMPNGLGGLIGAVPVAIFAFGGIELVGVAAADTRLPATIPAAADGIVVRVVLLYTGAVTALLVAVPWRRVPTDHSPFVEMLAGTGLANAASTVSLVVAAAALSSCNACLYATSRVLRALALEGFAPERLARANTEGTPVVAVMASFAVVAATIPFGVFASAWLFGWLMNTAALIGLASWCVFVIAHQRSARTAPSVTARRAGLDSRWSGGAVLLVAAGCIGELARDPAFRPALAAAIALPATLAACFRLTRIGAEPGLSVVKRRAPIQLYALRRDQDASSDWQNRK